MDHDLAYYLNILLNEKAVPIQAQYMKSYTDCDEMLERQSLVEKALIEEIKKVAQKRHYSVIKDLINISYFREENNHEVSRILESSKEIPVVYIKQGTGLSVLNFPLKEEIKEDHTLFAPMRSIYPHTLVNYILMSHTGIIIETKDFKVRFWFVNGNFEKGKHANK